MVGNLLIFVFIFTFNLYTKADEKSVAENKIVPIDSSTKKAAHDSESPAMTNQTTPILNGQVPVLAFCRVGQRFVLNHIMYVCHQFGDELRGFRPFACVVRTHPETKLLAKHSTMDDTFFRYKCVFDSRNGTLRLQAISCIVNEIQIRVGESLRRGRSEYLCNKDSHGMLTILEKQMLHDYCLSGNKNDSLLDGDKCPGISVGVINSRFGYGNEVIFDTKEMVIVPSAAKKASN